MDSNLGEFVTKEYGLIRQILSYLKPSDLHNARLVCREWMKTVDNLVEKIPQVIPYNYGKKNPMAYPKKPILPDLLIYQHVVNEEFLKPDECKVCKQRFLVCYCELAGPETAVLALNNKPTSSSYNSELYTFWQLPSVLTLSFGENIRLSTYFCIRTKTRHSGQWSQTDLDDVKGVFLIAKSSCRRVFEGLLNELVDRQGLSFAVGGGIADVFYINRDIKNDGNIKKYGICIIFKGDNVSAQSELVTGKDANSIENSMAELKKRAGEVPKDGMQIAFIAQCVDRRNENLEKLESGLFRKYFPDVPQFGFPAWGEFGIKSGSSDGKKPKNTSKKKKHNFCHAYTTSILIVTFRRA